MTVECGRIATEVCDPGEGSILPLSACYLARSLVEGFHGGGGPDALHIILIEPLHFGLAPGNGPVGLERYHFGRAGPAPSRSNHMGRVDVATRNVGCFAESRPAPRDGLLAQLSDDTGAAIICDPRDELQVLHVAGKAACFAELDHHQPVEIGLVQFGLLPAFIGQGLGQVVSEVDDRLGLELPA